jgi:pimeloyl-ACP methyl ester carboxylesterase
MPLVFEGQESGSGSVLVTMHWGSSSCNLRSIESIGDSKERVQTEIVIGYKGTLQLHIRFNRMMEVLRKDGVTLAYEDSNQSLPPMLLVHGCGCDHSSLAPQAEFFSASYRVLSVDLRGHGKSDAPHQDYTMAVFADDLAWLCKQLGLIKPIIIGHSMGGNVALEFAARYPEIPAAISMIDTLMFPAQGFIDALEPLIKSLEGPHYLAAYQQALSSLCLRTDEHAAELIARLQVSQHVLASAFPNHTTKYDGVVAATGCGVPVAYIGATVSSLADMARFQSLTPQLIISNTLSSGHFSPVEVPAQVNAMIARFAELNSSRLG